MGSLSDSTHLDSFLISGLPASLCCSLWMGHLMPLSQFNSNMSGVREEKNELYSPFWL